MLTPRRRKRDSFLPWIQLATDALSVYLWLTAVFWLRFGSRYFESALGEPDFPIYRKSFVIVIITLVLFLRSYGLYKPSRFLTFGQETARVFKAAAAATIVLLALTFFIRSFTFSRTFVLMAGVVTALGVSLGRYALGHAVMAIDRRRNAWHNLLIVGTDPQAQKLVRYYRGRPRQGTRVTGFLDDARPKGDLIEGVPVLGRLGDLPPLLKAQRDIHEVILSSAGLPQETLLKIVYACEKEMVAFRWIADMFGIIASRMSVNYFAGVPVLSFEDSPLGDWENRALKRATDIILSGAALLMLAPVFAAIAAAVKWDSPGPVFYGQRRIGEDGKRFRLYKFRTMRADAERETGAVWAREDDPRRTRTGAFLRRNNLDELPQLWNVLKGDMSLVGPRPERPFFVSRFREDIPRYMARHAIRSGITGWAQVNGLRGNTSIEDRTRYDLYYIENWSMLFDLKILFMTLFAKRNAY